MSITLSQTMIAIIMIANKNHTFNIVIGISTLEHLSLGHQHLNVLTDPRTTVELEALLERLIPKPQLFTSHNQQPTPALVQFRTIFH